MSAMETDLGTLLRHWRGTRQQSVAVTAQQAGVARMTLHRWESGQHLPRLPELEALLRVLEATPQQRQQALALLNAPRGAALLRQETAVAAGPGSVPPPLAGGLLHALRLRQGLSLGDAAARLRLHKSTLSCWEHGESLPPADRLHTLCLALDASAQELAFLTRSTSGYMTTQEAMTAPEIECELHRVTQLAPHEPEEAVKDLLFLRLEALAATINEKAAALELRADVNAAYANYLAGIGRYREASVRADRALAHRPSARKSEWWMYAALALARCNAFHGSAPSRVGAWGCCGQAFRISTARTSWPGRFATWPSTHCAREAKTPRFV